MANKKANALSDLELRKLKKPEVKQWVRDGNGLALCLTPIVKGDWRNWYFIYTSPETSKRRYYPLGSYPGTSLADARNAATQLLAEVKKAVDPMERERRDLEARQLADEQKRLAEEAAGKVITVAKLCSEYIERHAKRFKKSWQEDERILTREVIPTWSKRKAQDIVKRDVLNLLEKIVDRGSPSMANNSFQVIRKMFNFAVEFDILQYSPCYGVKLPTPKNSRDRAFSETEIKSFWNNLDGCSISPEIKTALRLILITAQRPGEVIGIHTREIDGECWNIPAERAKNGKAQRVHLTGLASDYIQKALAHIKLKRDIPSEIEYSGYIFPCPHLGKDQPIDRHAMAIAVMRNLSWPMNDKKGKPLFNSDGKPATENRFGVEHFTPHDLRRTAATFMAQAGEMDEVIDAVLNHAKQGIIKVYNQYRYVKEKKHALETWERKLNRIITGTDT